MGIIHLGRFVTFDSVVRAEIGTDEVSVGEDFWPVEWFLGALWAAKPLLLWHALIGRYFLVPGHACVGGLSSHLKQTITFFQQFTLVKLVCFQVEVGFELWPFVLYRLLCDNFYYFWFEGSNLRRISGSTYMGTIFFGFFRFRYLTLLKISLLVHWRVQEIAPVNFLLDDAIICESFCTFRRHIRRFFLTLCLYLFQAVFMSLRGCSVG